jgi:biopolymer transport protein ExbD
VNYRLFAMKNCGICKEGYLNKNNIMTEIQKPVTRRQNAGVRHHKKHNLKVDMTPMVDLGFLLISFFVITTELSRPKAMNLIMPKDGLPTPTATSKTITFLTGVGNKLFYYFGEEKDAGIINPVVQISWNEKTGAGKIIREKQLQLDHEKGGRDEMMVIIKPGKESTYKNVVDILDEMTIHGVKRYAVVKPGDQDAQYLERNR